MKILFLCEENSCRSQMAEGIVNSLYFHCCSAKSAGSKITPLDEKAILVMKEIGIDISQQKSKLVKEFLKEEFDYVITLCGEDAQEACPFFLGKAKNRLHWAIPNPKGGEISFYRKIRDELIQKIGQLCKIKKEDK